AASNLAQDFGGNSEPAAAVIAAFYNVIMHTENPKARIMYEEWMTLFGLVCGYDNIRSHAKIATLAQIYGISPGPDGFNPTALIFAAHTYYALFMKLLTAEIASFSIGYRLRSSGLFVLRHHKVSAQLPRTLSQVDYLGT